MITLDDFMSYSQPAVLIGAVTLTIVCYISIYYHGYTRGLLDARRSPDVVRQLTANDIISYVRKKVQLRILVIASIAVITDGIV